MQMTMQEAVEILGMDAVEVVFGALSDAAAGKADLFVVSKEIEGSLVPLPVLGLENLMDADAAAEQLKAMME